MMLVTKAGRVRGFPLIVRCLAPLDLIRYPLCQGERWALDWWASDDAKRFLSEETR